MSCNILINQQAPILSRQAPIPVSDKIAPEAKLKDPERQKRSKKSHENYKKKSKERFLKNNQIVQKTLKKYID